MTVYSLFSHTGVPTITGTPSGPQSLGTEFSLSSPAALTGIWFFTPSGATDLPGTTAIYKVGDQAQVAGTLASSPSWSGAAGSQAWVKCSYDGSVTLAAATNYRVAVFASASAAWAWDEGYWSSGAGLGGITSGIISAPDNAHASDSGAQIGNHTGVSLVYPGSNADAGTNVWIDVEVTVSASGLLLTTMLP